MAEFVHSVDREVGLATVEEHEQEREPRVTFLLVVERKSEPSAKHRQPPTCLEEALDIRDGVHRSGRFFGERCAVPFDRVGVRAFGGLHTHPEAPAGAPGWLGDRVAHAQGADAATLYSMSHLFIHGVAAGRHDYKTSI